MWSGGRLNWSWCGCCESSWQKSQKQAMNGLHLGGGGGGSKQYRWKMVNHGRPVSCILLSSPLLFSFKQTVDWQYTKGEQLGDMRGTRGQEERGKRKEE
jgi:hypothetical protein